jgi:hypothetical protein
MSIYKIFPEADTTLYSAYPTKNTGLDEILEVSVKNSEIASTSDDIRRSIVKFNSNDIQTLWNKTSQGAYNYDAYLKLYLANAENLSTSYTLYFNQVDVNWDMGTGKFADSPSITNGACWYTTGSYSSSLLNWPNPSYYITVGGGSWNYSTVSQSFTNRDSKDINVKVTSYFQHWISGNTNAGILIKHANSIENNSNSYKVLNFFSGDTHTIFPPCLEIRWDDSIYITGSLNVIDNSDTVLNIANNPYTIKNTTEKYSFKITARDKYPVRIFSTASIYNINKALPSSSYWAIQDVKTEDMIIDFDSNYTKISCDATSSFFDLYINGLEPERYYKIIVKSLLDSGETIVVDNDCIFKIIR